MRIQDLYRPLTEGRDAPLYHWVDYEKLVNILKNNAMPAKFTHTLPTTNERIVGNSLSRNPKFDASESQKIVRLKLDQSKLAQTNKMIPLDAEVVHHYKSGITPIPDRNKEPEAVRQWMGTDLDQTAYENVMAEEFVIGDIKPLNKYLTEIFILDPKSMQQSIPRRKQEIRDEVVQLVQMYGRKYGIPITSKLGR